MTTENPIPRTALPIPDRQHVGVTTMDAKDPDCAFPPIEPLRPPAGAPNVLIILLDDIGFGASTAFGGPCATPVAERLAVGGLKFTRFHTTALCAPTRQALLTGRNHHSSGMGGVPDMATSAPGYTSMRPKATAPLAEILTLNGFSTAQFGKCHEVPMWQANPSGPYDSWPAKGGGFEYFYGFLAGETNQWYPALCEGTKFIEADKSPEEGYHFTEDMTDKAIAWVRQQKSLMPDKPFFMYYAPGATHAPHHVPKEWADKYKGRFDDGWDALRERTFARQKQLGVIPADCDLTRRPDEIPAWEEMPEELKPVLARQMEVYAGFLEHTDFHIGRLLDVIEDLGVLDDTLTYYIVGDNGASAEGTINGTLNEMFYFNSSADLETIEYLREHIDDFGGPEAYNHYAVGWAHAMSTPYQWTKQVASHWGGTRNGTIVSWTNGFTSQGQLRHQFHHVIDVATTVLDVAGIPAPDFVNGIQQEPMHGVSMRYCFDDADAPEARETQYFEMLCNRGIYHKGLTAVTKHRTPWVTGAPLPDFDEDVWELYDTNSDWTQAHDIAKEHPHQLRRLQDLFMIEATKYKVFPLDDRLLERFLAALAGRPELVQGNSQILYGGMDRLTESSVINVKNVSHSVTAEIDVPDGNPTGVLVAQGGRFGGWVLYLLEGKPVYCYNLLGIAKTFVRGDDPIPAGTHQVRVEFDYAGGLGAAADLALYLDGSDIGKGHLDRTTPIAFSGDEGTDIGSDTGSPIVDEYAGRDHFPGTIRWVQIDVGQDNHNHLITPEQRFHVAMARQ